MMRSNSTGKPDGWWTPCPDGDYVWKDDRFEEGTSVGECSAFVLFPAMMIVFMVIVSWIAFRCAKRQETMKLFSFAHSALAEEKIRTGVSVRRIFWIVFLLSSALQPLVLLLFTDENPTSAVVLGAVLTTMYGFFVELVHEEFEAFYRGRALPSVCVGATTLLWALLLAMTGLQTWVWKFREDDVGRTLQVYEWNSSRAVDVMFWTSVFKSSLALGCCIVMGILAWERNRSSRSNAGDATTAYANLDTSQNADDSLAASPELRSGWLGRISFSWMDPLMIIGAARTLKDNDLYRLAQQDKSETCLGDLKRAWVEEERAPETASLSRALRKGLGYKFMLAGLLKFVYDTQQFIGPQLLKLLIDYMSTDTPKSDKGTYAASALFLPSSPVNMVSCPSLSLFRSSLNYFFQ